MKFVDVSGVGNSGKSALVDLLRELDGFYVPEYWFEFDFIRTPGGLLDLRHSLLEDWSPVRSDAAYKDFVSLIDIMGPDVPFWDLLGWFRTSGHRFDRRFKGVFTQLSMEFVKSFVLGSYKAYWSFETTRESNFQRSFKRVARRFGFGELETVYLLNNKDFDKKARAYMAELYRSFVPPNTDHIIFNNGFEPFNPGPGLTMLGARQIVVLRDPRDIYVAGLNSRGLNKEDAQLLATDNYGFSKSFLSTGDLQFFVERYKLYREQLCKNPRQDVLIVNFEELTGNYNVALERILRFLTLESQNHIQPQKYFNPAKSSKNVGLWRSYSKKDEIRFIESELSQYLSV